MRRGGSTAGIAALSLALVLVSSAHAAPAPVAAAGTSACSGATCAWSLDDATFATTWTASVAEVAPSSRSSAVGDTLTATVNQTERAGTFYFSSEPVPIPVGRAAVLSLFLRSSGSLDRFPILVRETGFAGAKDRPESGDTVFFVPPSPDRWTFFSFLWRPLHADSTSVGLALRGEVQAGASATISFAEPYFGPELATWTLDGNATPFAQGPRAATTFTAPGHHVVIAHLASGASKEFTLDGPSVNPDLGALDMRPSPVLPGGVRLAAEAVEDEWQPDLLRRGDFAAGTGAWALAPSELGRVSSVSTDASSLRIHVQAAPQESSVWVAQPVVWSLGRPYEFYWRAHDDRALLRYETVVVEADGTRHVSGTPPGGSWGTGATVRFTPHTARGEIQLRAIFQRGATGDVWFDRASLRPQFAYAWALDGRPVGDDAPLVDLALDRSAAHVVAVSLVDSFGAHVERTTILPSDLALGEPTLRVRGDVRAALMTEPATLDLGPSWEGSFDALATASPWAGWRAEDGEAPGRVVFTPESSGIARVDLGPARSGFGGGVARVIGAPARTTGSDLVFRYRTLGNVTSVEAIVRDQVPGIVQESQTGKRFAPTSNWTTAWLFVPPRSGATSLWLVDLRAILPPNATGALEISNATLAPAFSYSWARATGPGPIGTLASAREGPRPWSVTVASPGGLSWSANGTVGFLAPSAPFATLSGGIAARWNASVLPPGVTMHLDGPSDATASGAEGRLESPALVPGEYRLFAESPGGERLFVGAANIAGRASVVPPVVTNATRGVTGRLSFHVSDPEVVRASASVGSWPFTAEITLARKGSLWTGEWRVPLGWLAMSAPVRLHLEDDRGHAATIDGGSVDVAPAPHATDATLVVLLCLGGSLLVWRPSFTRPRARRALADALVSAVATLLAVVLVGASPDGPALVLLAALAALAASWVLPAVRARPGLVAASAFAPVALALGAGWLTAALVPAAAVALVVATLLLFARAKWSP